MLLDRWQFRSALFVITTPPVDMESRSFVSRNTKGPCHDVPRARARMACARGALFRRLSGIVIGCVWFSRPRAVSRSKAVHVRAMMCRVRARAWLVHVECAARWASSSVRGGCCHVAPTSSRHHGAGLGRAGWDSNAALWVVCVCGAVRHLVETADWALPTAERRRQHARPPRRRRACTRRSPHPSSTPAFLCLVNSLHDYDNGRSRGCRRDIRVTIGSDPSHSSLTARLVWSSDLRTRRMTT